MKESDEHNGLYQEMVARTGMSEEEVDEFIFEQVVAKAADHESVQEALDRKKAEMSKRTTFEQFKKFQEDNQ